VATVVEDATAKVVLVDGIVVAVAWLVETPVVIVA
jgi:hypothetical protein